MLEGLNQLAANMTQTTNKGSIRVAKGIYREANVWLSGAGGASKRVRSDYTGFTKKSGQAVSFRSYQGAGRYPVPIRAGNLKRLLDWLEPGQTKQGEAGTFTAGPNEVVIYDSAEYADTIHEGKGSSAKYGPRPYMTDALEIFNTGSLIRQMVDEEIQKEIDEKGLK
jgi:hypothetical protein